MMSTYAIVWIASLATLWTLAVIPLLIVLALIARRLLGVLREAELHMGPAFVEIRDAARHLNKASAGVSDGVAHAGHLFEAMGEIGKTLHNANTVIKNTLGPTFGAAMAAVSGLKAGSRYFFRRLWKRR